MLIFISWRNIWRHPARSGVLLGAIIAGMWAGIMVSGLTNGMMEQRFNNLIEESITHVQIHHPEFVTERDPDMFIRKSDEIIEFLRSLEEVHSFTARTLAGGMIQSPQTTAGVQIQGVKVEWEKSTTTFHENMTRGDYLNTDTRNALVMGEELADKLEMEMGKRVVLTFPTADGEMTSAAFNITGLYRSASSQFDAQQVFVRSSDLSELIAGETVYHEIAMMLNDADSSEVVASRINDEFPNVKAETWYQISPELRYIADFGNSMTFYVMLVIMLALAFGILNTMLMAIFERMRELGMLMAVGMSKGRIFLMIMFESIMLTCSGAIAGMLLAYLSIQWLGDTGIDMAALGGESLSEFGYDTVVYPVITSADFMAIAILVVVTVLVSAVYPSYKALKIKPADVVRE
ncbi:ABC transporter permease [Rhodohalobacter sp. 8-1]|uniref:ABC transporter permease n=1 Tax=Rhodohalobacter sp. 8-1 TaxID=3131972 RepID=UPI0030EE18BA